MRTPFLIFVGIQLLSLLTAGMLIHEHRRLCKEQELIFNGLGGGGRGARRRNRYMVVAFYLLTTIAIIAITAYVLPTTL